MCTHPIVVNRKYRGIGKSKPQLVPCGKCAECLQQKRNEIAALAVIQANKSGSMHFFTATYNNRSIPLRVSGPGFDESDFMRGYEVPESSLALLTKSCQPVESKAAPGVVVCPSLRRKDLQLFFKRCRVSYFRKFGEKLNLVYLAFGEYGDRLHRPHYHFLTFGLSDSQANYIASCWQSEFGFVDAVPVPAVNKDGSSGYAAAASYIAKYISKGDFVPQFVRDGLAEPPRRISSIHFGHPSPEEVEKMKNFTLPMSSADAFLKTLITRRLLKGSVIF